MNSGDAPVAVITGAGRGIGAAVAARVVARGGRVVLAARNHRELEATATALEHGHGARGRVRIQPCDVASAADVAALRDAARDWAHSAVDLLVNNAGIVRRAPAHEMDEADWDAVLDINLKGTFLCTRALLPDMLARGRGRIVNVASISATLGTAQQSAYCASKWGV